MDNTLTVGSQIDDYAGQVADINRRIGQYYRAGTPEGDEKAAADALKQQRDGIHSRAKALTEQTKKAGAEAPDFYGAVKKASAAPPKDTAPPLIGGPSDPPNKLTQFRQTHGNAYDDLSDEDLADKLYTKHYSDMPREEFDKKMGIESAKPGYLESALKPIKAIPGNIAEKFSEGVQTAKEGMPKNGSDFGNPLKTVGGVIGAATAPATGIYKSLVTDPAQANLPDTRLGRAVGGTVEQVGDLAAPIPGAAAVKGVAGAAGRAAKEVGVLGKDIAGAFTGKPAKEALEAVRQPIVGEVGKAAAEHAARFKTLTEEYAAAGKDAATASKAAEEHAGLLDQAEQGVKALDEKLLADPKLPAKDFGDVLHKTVSDMEDKYITQRAEESGYTKALDVAKDKVVDTTPVTQVMDDWAKITNTKGTDEVIKEVKHRMSSIEAGAEGDVANATQTVAKLNSFRKQIGDALRTKVFSDKAVDSETYKVLQAAKNAIDGVIDGATPELTAARQKWAELSSPLDIMSQKGPLAKVLAVNPAGRDAAMAGAQVAGEIIKRANQGHPVFTRMLEHNPGLRDDARMYFAQDLFGGGKAPSPTALKAWLEKNRESLIQTKLFDEFSDIHRAKLQRAEAVDKANGTVKESMAKEKAALQREKKLGGEKDAAETATKDYARFESDLRQKPDKAAPTETRKMLKKLHADGRIDTDTYEDLVRETHKIDDMRLGSDAMKERYLKVAKYGLLYGGMSYAGLNAFRALIP